NYKGVAINSVNGHPRLYAADFHNAKIDVFDEHYNQIRRHDRFEDPSLPDGYAPFNIVSRGPFLFVTYAKQDEDAEDDDPGPGRGFLVVFDADGDSHRRLVSRGA